MRRSFSRCFSALAEQDPEGVVVVADDATLTAGALDRASNRLARAYAALGVTPDSLVAVSLPNSAELVLACAAIWKAGATPQPLSRGLSARELAEVGALGRPSLSIGVELDGVPFVPAGFEPDPALPDDELPDIWAASWKAPASSGSTGRPKIVLAAAPAQMDPTQPVAAFLPREGVQLVAGPLTHSATFTYAFRGLLTGQRLVILPRFDEARVLAAIAEHRVTWALLVPTMIHRLLRTPAHRDADVSSLEAVLHLGSPCPPADKRALIEWIGAERVVEVYAGSESNGLTMIRGDEWRERPGSVGRPIGGTELRVLRSDGSECAVGEPGLVQMRRGEPTYRYLGGESKRTDDGWDTLGDLGSVDADGYLTVLDRADDLILRGGVNVYPAEIERVLEEHPAVRGAVAFGVADAELGQAVESVVDIAESDVTEEELLAFSREHLGSRAPRALRLQRSPLRDDAGKIRRGALAAE
ncbi:AMP-binding protein [Rathayibacter sp. VKM Ac-2927]|uniref:AMP-binding protein n=1 Tax=Rathayibacter sp. VKM Ac-2927 TaxID=2929478 RepID=UPI001FB38CCA|nr:AMP-binding protein [Rathayibacter sp. VKM Ac-2927]MCJ1689063.1 AMP-binding protein [Rathayibacter sp. VKM Ac-2927]